MGTITLDKGFVDFLKKYLETHKIERMKEGKDTTSVSIIREALFCWAEKNGCIDELYAILEHEG